jgi:hypothetical protein
VNQTFNHRDPDQRAAGASRRVRSRRCALGVVAVLGIAACSGEEAAEETTTVAETTTTIAETTTTIAETTTTELEVVEVLRMPLTGMPIESAEEIPARPALAVKIDNHPRGRPQAGLNEADIVFEENVENLTRFAAVFHSQDSDPVGPIRSGRSQDVGILTAFRNPLFAWSGGNGGVRALIRESAMVDLDAGFARGYYRRSGVGGAPHNLYSSTDALWAQSPDEFMIPPVMFPYLNPGEDAVGAPAATVVVPMDGVRVRWEYDADSGLYLRYQNDAEHQSELTGQVSTDNVVVMGVDYVASSIDRNSPEAITWGVGPVVVFSRGVVQTGYWSRESMFEPYTLTLNDPTGLDESEYVLLGLVPGRTWVELARDGENFATWQ